MMGRLNTLNTPRLFSTAPQEIIAGIWHNRQLILQLVKREIIGRYRGSILGLVWCVLNPILMLVVYTVFFTVMFKARWGENLQQSHANFAIVLFVGLIIYGFFSECVNKAPILVVGNVNFVKKVIFPLEILPIVTAVSALFHAGISLVILVFAQILLGHSISWTIIFFPFIIFPFVMLTLGVLWFLAALGVYIRDISHVVGMVTSVLLFMSPVFYSIESLPAGIQRYLMLNPLTFIIEQSRNVIIYSQQPDWMGLVIYFLIGFVVALAGFWCFQRLRKGFADVL